ncbi:putative dynein heavy chain [Toxoplasma gondii p89]|uniref:Putative dynein heavy chain n=1 Tax=Toxoplasma gondii p89 TaxID=943119 RepID=A0A086L4U3_TOXGO|nr:putative dynein heavy chain [Toxoplasma gondii p89]
MSDKDRIYMRDNLFFFAIIWSFGACIDAASRALFDRFFRRWLAGTPQLLSDFNMVNKGDLYQPRPLRHGLPDSGSIFDFFFDKKTLKWSTFSLLVPSLSAIPEDAKTHTLVVPTPDTVRNKLFLEFYALRGVHTLMVGVTGTGKTTCISSMLKDASTFDRDTYTYISLCFSAKTTANEVQDVIDSRVDRSRTKGVFAPSLGRKCLVFLDDLNLPAKEVYGAQPVIELLRQWHSMGGWYDRKSWEFRQIEKIQFLAAMGVPGGSRQHLPPRYLRYFNLLYLPAFAHASLVMIFDTVLSWKYRCFPAEIQTQARKLIEATVEVYTGICQALPPTPSRSHYTFNLRDVSRVVEGLCFCTKDAFRSSDDLYRCWIHEVQRVFCDRLVCREDKSKVFSLLAGVLESRCRRRYCDLVPAGSSPILFCDFVHPKRPYYQQVTLEELRDVAQRTLSEYNALYLKSPMNLVFFTQALKHLTRVVRILQQPKGNGLLVGFGGSGRKSLTRLATFLVGFEIATVDVTRSYGVSDWREDVKAILVKAGGHRRHLTFLLSDSQLTNDAFLDDVANLLNTGEIPNIFSTEDKIGILDLMSHGSVSSSSSSSSLSSSASTAAASAPPSESSNPGDLFELFVENCRQYLHMMLFFSPSGETLRHTIRLFPALVNCCAIDWFSQWREPSLEAVAREELCALRLGSLLTTRQKPHGARDSSADRGERQAATVPRDPPEEQESVGKGAGADACQSDGAMTERSDDQEPAARGAEAADAASELGSRHAGAKTLSDDAVIFPDSASHLSSIFASMQLDVDEVTVQYRQELRRHYYITPRSYIEFLKLFSHLSVAKREELNRQVDQYRVGLEKIHSTSTQVGKIQEELETLKPQLIKASQDMVDLMVDISKMQESAARTKATVEVEEAQCKSQADAAAEVREQCKAELDTALPALTAAVEALKKLSKSDITELNSMKSPPAGVIKVVEALCKMFSIKPAKVKSADSMRKAYDYWTASKKHLLSDTKFLQRLFTYDKDHIPVEVMSDILPYQTDPDFDPEVIKKASVAATSLCKWVRAIIVYDQVAKVVEPKQKNLEKAEAELAVAAEKLDEKKRELTAVEELLERLLAEHKAAEHKKEELKKQFDECSLRLQVAERLINDLAGENTRWKASFHELKLRIQTLLGELLVTSAVIAYSGVFPAAYRQRCLQRWRGTLARYGVELSAHFDIQKAVGDSLQIQTWIVNMLPNDPLSIENAIILSLSTRWPLLIDPQNQATRWLKKTYPDMIVLRASGDAYFRSLQLAVQMGSRVLIEHCSEALDPSLDSLLSRAVFKAGNIDMIRLRDTTVEYAKTFHLSLSTLLGNPHFSPEHCAQLTMLNFSVTPEGLEDQLLGALVALEQPAIEAKRQALIVESSMSKKQLQDLEKKILHLLSNAKGDILDDRELIGTLSSSKAASQAIEDRVEEYKKTAEIVDSTRAIYRPVAYRTAGLFFAVADLATIDRMYHFSVEWFLAIFVNAIEAARDAHDDLDDIQMHLEEIDRQFLSMLYENVCRSLFEKDKLLFSLLLALTSLRVDNELETDQLKLLLMGGVTGREISYSKPARAEDWLPDLAWTRLVELAENAKEGALLSNFLGLFQETVDDWRDVFESEEPLDSPWPHDLDQRATELEKCLLIQALRPDCLLKAMRNLVEDTLGAFFLEPPAFDLALSYKLSTPTRPIVFALSAGADPMEAILKLAQANRMEKKLVAISLGQGQDPKAAAAIETAVSTGAWILLQNCHLSASFLPQLERIVEEFPLRDVHPDFRLLLTSMPSPQFPESVLLNSVKVTNEPPRGLRQNLLRSYLGFDESFLEDHPKPTAWKNMLFALCFFHAMLLERRKFGPLGWNVPYEFSQSDMQISIQQLRHFVGAFDQIPWKTLKYLAAETNYGGRITDPWDRRLINYLIDDIYCPEILEEGFCLSASEGIEVPPATFTLEEYLDFIREMPTEESPEVYTLHPNANMSVAISEASSILDAVLSLQPRTSSGNASGSSSTPASAVAQKLQDQLPELFDIAAVEQKYPVRYEEILNTVLVQELSRYNRLLKVIKAQLKALQDAENGLVLLTPELEELGNNLSDNRVPREFLRFAYPSMKPLSSWIKDLIQRLQFFSRWVDEGPPAAFWLPGFFFTQSFLTAVLQSFSRLAQVPIDEICLDFEVLQSSTKSETDAKAALSPPSVGCHVYGLYLEGARWDDDETVVAEAHPGVLFHEMPMIWIEPCESSRPRKSRDVYECPVYKTAARAGTLSTTGLSTNYVLTVRLPIDPHQSSAAYWAKRGVALLLQLST